MVQQDMEQGSIDERTGVWMPAPSEREQYIVGDSIPGNELGSQVPGLTADLPTADGTQNMGSMGYDGGAYFDESYDQAMRGILSVVPEFNDREPEYNPGGHDAMRGVTSGAETAPIGEQGLANTLDNIGPGYSFPFPEQDGETDE